MSDVKNIISKAREQKRNTLFEHEAKDVLSLIGLPTTRYRVVKNKKEAVKAAHEIGFPVVLKIVSSQVLHKSDAGGVALDIEGEDELITCYDRIVDRVKEKVPDADIRGVLVEEMASPSVEVIVGATRDAQFGPTVMFGVGGILTEIIRDVSFRVAPFTFDEAIEMMGEIKSHEVLEGARGLPQADKAVLADILVKTSKLMLKNPGIAAIDLNPVIVYEYAAKIVDARIILGDEDNEVGDDEPAETLGAVLDPSSVAVVGASANSDKIGHKILKNIVDAGFSGAVYPVNPRGGEILGLEAYPSVLDIPGDVEAVVVVVPSRFVPGVIDECVKKGVKGAVIISSGFKDIGPEGAKLEKEVLEKAAQGGIRIVGPNCQGVSNPVSGFCATWPLIKRVGDVAVISQSGSIALEVPSWLVDNHLGYSKSIALGNKSDVDEADLISWFGSDEDTRVIAVYTEGTNEGRKLMKAVSCASSQKPVLILKGGKTEAGRRAVLAHTGSLAGSNQVFEAAVSQSGGFCVGSLEELLDAAKAFSMLPVPGGSNLLVVTSSGGAGILSSDASEKAELTLNPLSRNTVSKLKAVLPDYCILRNPLDLTGNALTEPDMYRKVLEVALETDEVDMILVVFGDPIPDTVDILRKVVEKAKKKGVPVAVNYLGGADVQKVEVDALQRNGIPVFQTPERAITALGCMNRYRLNRSILGDK
ncbi:acetate--CoA ligase family protein [Candidatus Bathyarchaeota archaeon]|nr:acetate--CoA ligase family protein [Candidatus Bathyarchaeota archaeon]